MTEQRKDPRSESAEDGDAAEQRGRAAVPAIPRRTSHPARGARQSANQGCRGQRPEERCDRCGYQKHETTSLLDRDVVNPPSMVG